MPAYSKTESRRGLAIFLAVVVLCSVILVQNIGTLNALLGKHFILIYMWCVTGASIVARLIMRESPGDISFRWNGWTTSRAMLVGTLLPLAVGLITYGIAWATGLAEFAAPRIPQIVLGISITGTPEERFFKHVLISLTVGALWSCKSAAGEEIGWRGYMLKRLRNSGLPVPIFTSGLIWGLWHVPLILSGEYTSVPNSTLPIAVFVINITTLGYVFAWLRLSSGSIWPCIWAHGVWNEVILGSFGSASNGGAIWLGEAGLFTTLATILLAVALYRLWPLHPARNQEPQSSQIL